MASHPFHRPSVRYGNTPEPVTPYQKAQQVWDERLGSARVQASNWRLAALAATALSTVLCLTLSVMIGRSSVVPGQSSTKTSSAGTAWPMRSACAWQAATWLSRLVPSSRWPVVLTRA